MAIHRMFHYVLGGALSSALLLYCATAIGADEISVIDYGGFSTLDYDGTSTITYDGTSTLDGGTSTITYDETSTLDGGTSTITYDGTSTLDGGTSTITYDGTSTLDGSTSTITYDGTSTLDGSTSTTDGGGISGSAFGGTTAEALRLKITEIHVDFDYKVIEISGVYFDLGLGPLQVTLGDVGDIAADCTTDLASIPQTISCDFWSAGLPPDGDYLVTLSTGDGQSDQYNLTIGAVGPPGETGAVGPQGAQGLAGQPDPEIETMVLETQDAICELYLQLALPSPPPFCQGTSSDTGDGTTSSLSN